MAKKFRNVVAAVVNTPWLITPEKAQEICALLERRANGDFVDHNAVRAEFMVADNGDDDEEEPMIIDGVQVIQVLGTMMPRANMITRFSGGTSTQLAASEILTAIENPNVKTILFEVDSPGGAYSGVPELTHVMRRAASAKRTVTSARNQMASGSYWVGTSARQVFAGPSTSVGSVGVYTIVSEQTKAAEEAGIKFHVLRAGRLKAAGLPVEKLTDERKASLQATVDTIYQQFAATLAQNRKVTAEQVLETFGEGATFLADEAADRGMIDGVKIFEEVLDHERSLARGRVMSSGFFTGTRVSDDTGNKESSMKITDKIRAALFARGMVKSVDAADEVCESAIVVFYAVSGFEWKDDEKAILDHLTGTAKTSIATLERVAAPLVLPDRQAAPPVQTPDQATQEERARVRQLRAKAELFGVDAADVDVAIDSGMGVDHWCGQWSDRLARREGNIIRDVRNIQGGPAELDKFTEEAVNVLGSKLQLKIDPKIVRASTMRNFATIDIARSALMVNGIRPSGDKEQDALRFLQLGGSERRTMVADGGPVDGAGNHPDLLSGLTGKILEKGYGMAEVHYTKWTERLMDMPDFKPKLFIEMGIFGELDISGDDEELNLKQFDSDPVGWIQQDRYRNGVGLNVRMIADDDLDGFNKQIGSFPAAAERTLNNLCIKLLVGNFAMLDGSVLFATGNSNDISGGSGGPPSNTQASLMRKLHRLQTNPGTEGANVPINIPPSIALAPAALEDASYKTFLFSRQDPKEAATDDNINTVRGTIMPIIDSYLDSFSAAVWYTFIDPGIHGAFAHAFMTGFGAGGRRQTWFDNNRAVRMIEFETRFAACAKSRRGICRNPGA